MKVTILATLYGDVELKVVIVSSVPALPTDAGNRARIRALAEEVVRLGNELILVLLPTDRHPHDIELHQRHFEALDKSARVVGLSNGGAFGNRWYRLLRSVRKGWRKPLKRFGLPAGFYTGLDQFWNPLWDRHLKALCADADVVIVEYAFNTRAFGSCPASAKKILDTHDVLADRHVTYAEKGMPLDYWLSLKPEDELAAFQRADIVLAIQPFEAREFHERLEVSGDATTRVSVVSHFPVVVETPLVSESGTSGLFVGSDNPSNREALRTFLTHVLPIVQRQLPDFRLVVAGTICRRLVDQEGLEKAGVVGDLTLLYSAAAMSINPMQIGTGINIKLLDAMSNGLPVVTTATGARGLQADQRGGLLVSDDDDYEAFAANILELAENTPLRLGLGEAALAASRNWVIAQRQEFTRSIEAPIDSL